MAGNLVTVATFDLPAKARLAQNVLEAAGIKAVVTDETIVAMDWLLGNAVGWVKVQVLEEDAERAVAALEESLGGAEEPVDEAALAAEAEAAKPEEGSELPKSELPTPSGPATSLVARSVATEPQEDAEEKPSERDEYARRLFFAAVFSLVFAPLWFYALYLFLNAAFGEGPISARGRSHLLYGGAIVGVTFFLVAAFFAFI